MFAGVLTLWAALTRVTAVFLLGTPATCFRPALAPVRRDRRNARRLTGL